MTGTLPAALAGREVGQRAPFDLVFADPPYAFTGWAELLERVEPVLAPGGEIAVEHGRRERPPEKAGGLSRRAVRAYGETELSFYSPASEPLPDMRPRSSR